MYSPMYSREERHSHANWRRTLVGLTGGLGEHSEVGDGDEAFEVLGDHHTHVHVEAPSSCPSRPLSAGIVCYLR